MRIPRATFFASSSQSAADEGANPGYAAGTRNKQTRSPNAPLTSDPLKELVGRYRLSQGPLPVRFENGLANSNKLKAKKAAEHEAKDTLNKQRKARIGLRLYDTLTPESLSQLYAALTNFDIRQELPTQEHDTIPRTQELAKDDSSWEVRTQTRHPESGNHQVNASLGKRLHKVYRFDDWNIATKHFWRRINEYFEQQDVSGTGLCLSALTTSVTFSITPKSTSGSIPIPS